MEYRALSLAVPYKSIESMMNRLQLTEADFLLLHQHKEVFISRRNDFADYFYKTFDGIPETHMLLGRFGRPDAMRQIWSAWFERLFSSSPGIDFFGYIWRVGLRHVEINLDQRFSNLGFSIVRQFCQRLALENFSPQDSVKILSAVDKLIDLCLLIETGAYIDSTVRCDIEILKGIADKIRNPVTIIGGNIRRLQRQLDPQAQLFKDYEFLMSYAGRCEDMIQDINTYMETFQREAVFGKCLLEAVIENVIDRLSAKKKLDGVRIDMQLDRDARFVWGDPTDLRHLFYHLLENAAEASRAAESPMVSIIAAPQETPSNTVRIEIFNNGAVINLDNIQKFFSPFYSTKVESSGLGLSIAMLVIRKNYGDIFFEPVPHSGTKVYVTLQKAD